MVSKFLPFQLCSFLTWFVSNFPFLNINSKCTQSARTANRPAFSTVFVGTARSLWGAVTPGPSFPRYGVTPARYGRSSETRGAPRRPGTAAARSSGSSGTSRADTQSGASLKTGSPFPSRHRAMRGHEMPRHVPGAETRFDAGNKLYKIAFFTFLVSVTLC